MHFSPTTPPCRQRKNLIKRGGGGKWSKCTMYTPEQYVTGFFLNYLLGDVMSESDTDEETEKEMLKQLGKDKCYNFISLQFVRKKASPFTSSQLGYFFE